MTEQIQILLDRLYGAGTSISVAGNLAALMERYRPRLDSQRIQASAPLTAADAILIAYPDQVTEPGVPPLRTLADVCAEHLAEAVSGVHLLPFYPWSSDDGFSVKDYFAVAPEYGSWEDIAAFRPRFDLMFDAVFNHASTWGDWFQRFLRDEPEFRDFFVTVTGNPDLSQVVRPRALPLLTEVSTTRGPERVWTTFSPDQADLQLKNPRVLLALLDALLCYAAREARFIRLDAIAYLWKEIGTTCIHLSQTHTIIQLMRAVLDEVAPQVQLITETNVPHADNVSYFGDGANEAQLVYNFALPPLVLHALLRGDAWHLTRWAAALRTPSKRTAFFNFLASHDGIGLNPVRGILPDVEIDFLVERCQAHGGLVSDKHNADGSRSPYELNIVYFDAVNDPAAGEPLETQVNRFMAAQAVMLALAGAPGIYFHSLFGSRNDRAAALQSGIPRRINRQRLTRAGLTAELAAAGSLRRTVFERFRRLLAARRHRAAFDPAAEQIILAGDRRVFAVLRRAADGHRMLCLHNVSNERVSVEVTPGSGVATWVEVFGRRILTGSQTGSVQVTLQPYEVNWLAASGANPKEIARGLARA